MIVTCESCKSRYKIDDSKITGRGARITCPRCQHQFVVYPADQRPLQRAAAPPIPPPTPPPDNDTTQIGMAGLGGLGAAASSPAVSSAVATPGPLETSRPTTAEEPRPPTAEESPSLQEYSSSASWPRPDLEAEGANELSYTTNRRLSGGDIAQLAASLDFRKVGVMAWKVKVKIGLIYDFSDLRTLRKYIQDGRVTPTDLISWDGKNWKAIGEIPDLDAFFVETFERLSSDAASRPPEPEPVAKPPPPPVVEPPRTPAPTQPVTPTAQEMANRRIREQPRSRRSNATTPYTPPSAGINISLNWVIGGVGALAAIAMLVWYLRPEEKPVKETPSWFQNLENQARGVETPQGATGGGTSGDDIRNQINEEIKRQIEEKQPAVEEAAPVEEPIGLQPANVPSPTYAPSATPTPSATPAPTTSPTPTPRTPTPAPAAGSGASTWQDHAEVGDSAARSGDWSGAAMAYQKAASMNASSADLQKKLGIAQYNSGNLSGAEAALKKASSMGARGDVYKYLGHIARKNGDTSGANYQYQQYLKTNPPDASEIDQILKQMNGG